MVIAFLTVVIDFGLIANNENNLNSTQHLHRSSSITNESLVTAPLSKERAACNELLKLTSDQALKITHRNRNRTFGKNVDLGDRRIDRFVDLSTTIHACALE